MNVAGTPMGCGAGDRPSRKLEPDGKLGSPFVPNT